MSAAAGAGPRLKQDRWGTVVLPRSRKRPECPIAPFVLESKNSNPANLLRWGDNVDKGRVDDHERRSNRRCLLHWTRLLRQRLEVSRPIRCDVQTQVQTQTVYVTTKRRRST